MADAASYTYKMYRKRLESLTQVMINEEMHSSLSQLKKVTLSDEVNPCEYGKTVLKINDKIRDVLQSKLNKNEVEEIIGALDCLSIQFCMMIKRYFFFFFKFNFFLVLL